MALCSVGTLWVGWGGSLSLFLNLLHPPLSGGSEAVWRALFLDARGDSACRARLAWGLATLPQPPPLIGRKT